MQEKSENVYLLHSRYIRRDRAFLEKQIMDFAESEENGIWITTQIVEASLDIDFDILHTEMCTADSLYREWGVVTEKEDIFRKKQMLSYMIIEMALEKMAFMIWLCMIVRLNCLLSMKI